MTGLRCDDRRNNNKKKPERKILNNFILEFLFCAVVKIYLNGWSAEESRCHAPSSPRMNGCDRLNARKTENGSKVVVQLYYVRNTHTCLWLCHILDWSQLEEIYTHTTRQRKLCHPLGSVAHFVWCVCLCEWPTLTFGVFIFPLTPLKLNSRRRNH